MNIVQWKIYNGHWTFFNRQLTMEIGQRTSDNINWTMVVIQRTMGNGHQTQENGLWTMKVNIGQWKTDNMHCTLDDGHETMDI